MTTDTTPKPSKALQSVAKALEAHLGDTTLYTLAQAALDAAGDNSSELERLTKYLHSTCSHPDYEYETVQCARKQSTGETPEGEGWEWNPDYNDGGERFEYTEETYYRRLRSVGEAEREQAAKPVKEAVDLLRRGSAALVEKARVAGQDLKEKAYWEGTTYAQGTAGALDGDQGSIAALFDPPTAVHTAELLECVADRLTEEPHRLHSTMVEAALAIARRFTEGDR